MLQSIPPLILEVFYQGCACFALLLIIQLRQLFTMVEANGDRLRAQLRNLHERQLRPRMNRTIYTAATELDGRVVAALQRALRAMTLTHGARISMAEVSGFLNFDAEILALDAALTLLGIAPDEACLTCPPLHDKT
jgi:hypothetical protein